MGQDKIVMRLVPPRFCLGVVFSCFMLFVSIESSLQAQLPLNGSRPEYAKSSDAMAMYIVLRTYNLTNVEFREFKPKFQQSVAGGDPMGNIAEFAKSEGLHVATGSSSSDNLDLLGKLSDGIGIVYSPNGYFAICYPQTSEHQLVVASAVQGVEPIGWDEWDGRYLVISQSDLNVTPNRNSRFLYSGLAVFLMVISVIAYLRWSRT